VSEIWLTRHGETEWSRDGRHTSRTDLALTRNGEAAARRLKSKLADHSFSVVLSSPKRRALETARLAGFGHRVEIDDDLLEWDYGEYEGLTTEQIRADRPGWSIWNGPPPGGETADQVGERVRRVILRCETAGGDALLVAHGHVLRVLAAAYLGLLPTEGARFSLDTATVSVLGWEHEERTVRQWNAG
jgi:probable phosphoglycerate mutase